MSRRNKAKLGNVQAQPRCVFCKRRGKSKEHIWPEWAASILPSGQGLGHYRARSTNHAEPRLYELKSHSSELKARGIKAPCAACNNGWMSQLEETARPFLENIILGRSIHLAQNARRLLARYILVKFLILDLSSQDARLFCDNDLEAIYNGGGAPEGVSLRVFAYNFEPDPYVSQYFKEPIGLVLDAKQKIIGNQTLRFGHALFQCLSLRELAKSEAADPLEIHAIPLSYGEGDAVWSLDRRLTLEMAYSVQRFLAVTLRGVVPPALIL